MFVTWHPASNAELAPCGGCYTLWYVFRTIQLLSMDNPETLQLVAPYWPGGGLYPDGDVRV